MAPLTLHQVEDRQFAAAQRGFKIGNHYIARGEATIWKLAQLSETEAVFEEITNGVGKPSEATSSYQNLFTLWSDFKGNLPEHFPSPADSKYTTEAPRIDVEECRCKAFLKLVEVAKEHCSREAHLVYLLNPSGSGAAKRQIRVRWFLSQEPMLSQGSPRRTNPQARRFDQESMRFRLMLHLGRPK